MTHVLYSLATGRHRMIVSGDPVPPKPRRGEGVREMPDDVYKAWAAEVKAGGTRDFAQEWLNAQTGKVPTDDRYAIVDADGNVKGAVIACPDCGDAIPGCELVRHKEADAGWIFLKVAREFVKPALTLKQAQNIERKAAALEIRR